MNTILNEASIDYKKQTDKLTVIADAFKKTGNGIMANELKEIATKILAQTNFVDGQWHSYICKKVNESDQQLSNVLKEIEIGKDV